jgi:hypothetical protein
MQAQIHFTLSETGSVRLREGTPLRAVLEDELSRRPNALEPLLMSYHFSKRERVFDLSVDPLSFDERSFIVKYNTGLFNACADVDHTDSTRMRITYKFLAAGSSTILLEGEYIPEREPDEL